MIDVVAVRYQGRVSMLKLIDGTTVTRAWLVRQLEAGERAAVRPAPPAPSAWLHLVRVGQTEFLSIDPHESGGDNLGALPTF